MLGVLKAHIRSTHPPLTWSECDRSVVYTVVTTGPVCAADLHKALADTCARNARNMAETVELKILARSGTIYATVHSRLTAYASHHVTDTPTDDGSDDADTSRALTTGEHEKAPVSTKRKLAAVAGAFVDFVRRATKRLSREMSDIVPSDDAGEESGLLDPTNELNHYRGLGLVPRGVDLVAKLASRVVEYVECDDVSAPLGIKQNVYRCADGSTGSTTVHIDTVGPYNLTLASLSDFQNALVALCPRGSEARLYYVPPDGSETGALRVRITIGKGFEDV